MEILAVIFFIIGYLAIAFEHPLKLNKTATALVTGVLVWLVLALLKGHSGIESLSHHLASSAEILFFLLGAMTIVELVDSHQGFRVISKLIQTENPVKLLWISSIATFFLSALLDNLTTSIVLVTLLRKLITNKETRLFYAGLIVVAANAGGAWSPIGDVTTTMLWIGGQVSATGIMKALFIPSIISLIVPLLFVSSKVNKMSLGNIEMEKTPTAQEQKEGNIMLWAGSLSLIAVPIFKTITHLPPYMGILLALGIVWIISEILHSEKDEEDKKPLSVAHALSKIDTSSILFFLGILLAIGALESLGYLSQLAQMLQNTVGNQSIIVILIGIASSIVDNVPLVAATMGMYSITEFPMDHQLWEFIAFCAGTGGSLLIIGSAAGVAVMGMEQISFGWYLKKITLIAFLGYIAGAIAYLLIV